MQADNLTILVVEDDPLVRDMLLELLASEGYTVECAVDGADGLARLVAGGIDLVLLDRLLPALDGLELCRRVRAHEGDSYVPILMLTALTNPAQRQAGFAVGADDYIGKPFNVNDLLDRVQVWARTRQRLKAYHGELAQACARLAALDRQREEFLALVSHELRQPLAAIATMAAALSEAPKLDEPDRRALQHLQHHASSLSTLANDLLAVARLETGLFRLHPVVVDLGALVTAVAGETPEPTRVQVELPAAPLQIEADPERLGQAICNLLHNALKYSPPASPITVTVRGTITEAHVAVRDRGVGLAPAEISQLFQKYGRVRNSRTEGIPSVGLVLYLTRLLAESHGGRVTAESPGPDQGTTFTLTVPRDARRRDASGAAGAIPARFTPPRSLP